MQNSEKRFRAIYDAHVEELYAYMSARCGMDPAVAEDLTQDTFLAVYQSMGRFRGICSERTWVFRIAKNKLYDFYRARYRSAESLGLDDERVQTAPDDQSVIDRLTEQITQSGRVQDCMRRIPERYRLTLTLKYMEGMGVREIARLTGRPEKSIENMLQRARAAFARQYLQLERADRP